MKQRSSAHSARWGNRSEIYLPVCPARPEFPGALGQVAVFALKGDQLVDPGHRLAVPLPELGLVVPGIEVADRARAKDVQDSLGFGGEMRWFGCERIRSAAGDTGVASAASSPSSARSADNAIPPMPWPDAQEVAAVEQVAGQECRGLVAHVKFPRITQPEAAIRGSYRRTVFRSGTI